jgi:hypothetical protein
VERNARVRVHLGDDHQSLASKLLEHGGHSVWWNAKVVAPTLLRWHEACRHVEATCTPSPQPQDEAFTSRIASLAERAERSFYEVGGNSDFAHGFAFVQADQIFVTIPPRSKSLVPR